MHVLVPSAWTLNNKVFDIISKPFSESALPLGSYIKITANKPQVLFKRVFGIFFYEIQPSWLAAKFYCLYTLKIKKINAVSMKYKLSYFSIESFKYGEMDWRF